VKGSVRARLSRKGADKRKLYCRVQSVCICVQKCLQAGDAKISLKKDDVLYLIVMKFQYLKSLNITW